MRRIIVAICLTVIFISLFTVFNSPIFSSWKNKDVALYYLENGLEETGSSNIVSSIVWDFRGFDTMGEETVLFTSVACISALVIFGFIGRRKNGHDN
jgi:multicomponent Na+:H+ antiporter subunit B